MAKIKLEYIWLDGYKPTQNLRSKTKVEEHENFQGTIEELGLWSFDGSSTQQASGGASDCILKPVAIYPDPTRINGWLVMTEVMNADGTPHASNARATIEDDDNDFWFGFEQEYFIMSTDTELPLGFPRGGYQLHKECIIVLLAVYILTDVKLLKLTQIYVSMQD